MMATDLVNLSCTTTVDWQRISAAAGCCCYYSKNTGVKNARLFEPRDENAYDLVFQAAEDYVCNNGKCFWIEINDHEHENHLADSGTVAKYSGASNEVRYITIGSAFVCKSAPKK